ncbi:Prenyltransferase subunit beta like protein, partial [Aduncisulcus paluster]
MFSISCDMGFTDTTFDIEGISKFFELFLGRDGGVKKKLKQHYEGEKLTILFFAISALDTCKSLDISLKRVKLSREDLINFIYNHSVENDHLYGFSSLSHYSPVGISSKDDFMSSIVAPHLTMTQSSLLSLYILGGEKALSRIPRNKVLNFLKQTLHSNGSCSSGGESDIRFVYSFAVITNILQLQQNLSSEISRILSYIASCRTYDGAFSVYPEGESQGGPTYCAISAAFLLAGISGVERVISSSLLSSDGITPSFQLLRLISWLVARHRLGFQGRAHKNECTCYTFWCGSTLACLESMLDRSSVCVCLRTKEGEKEERGEGSGARVLMGEGSLWVDGRRCCGNDDSDYCSDGREHEEKTEKIDQEEQEGEEMKGSMLDRSSVCVCLRTKEGEKEERGEGSGARVLMGEGSLWVDGRRCCGNDDSDYCSDGREHEEKTEKIDQEEQEGEEMKGVEHIDQSPNVVPLESLKDDCESLKMLDFPYTMLVDYHVLHSFVCISSVSQLGMMAVGRRYGCKPDPLHTWASVVGLASLGDERMNRVNPFFGCPILQDKWEKKEYSFSLFDNSQLESLDIRLCDLSDSDCDVLSRVIKRFSSSLRSLSIFFCDISEVGLHSLHNGLKQCSILETLKLRLHNGADCESFGDKFITSLVNLILRSLPQTISELYLEPFVNASTIEIISKSVAHLTNLSKLSFLEGKIWDNSNDSHSDTTVTDHVVPRVPLCSLSSHSIFSSVLFKSLRSLTIVRTGLSISSLPSLTKSLQILTNLEHLRICLIDFDEIRLSQRWTEDIFAHESCQNLYKSILVDVTDESIVNDVISCIKPHDIIPPEINIDPSILALDNIQTKLRETFPFWMDSSSCVYYDHPSRQLAYNLSRFFSSLPLSLESIEFSHCTISSIAWSMSCPDFSHLINLKEISFDG